MSTNTFTAEEESLVIRAMQSCSAKRDGPAICSAFFLALTARLFASNDCAEMLELATVLNAICGNQLRAGLVTRALRTRFTPMQHIIVEKTIEFCYTQKYGGGFGNCTQLFAEMAERLLSEGNEWAALELAQALKAITHLQGSLISLRG
jgi:hypothetical protein